MQMLLKQINPYSILCVGICCVLWVTLPSVAHPHCSLQCCSWEQWPMWATFDMAPSTSRPRGWFGRRNTLLPPQQCPCTKSQPVPETKEPHLVPSKPLWLLSAYQFEFVSTKEDRSPGPVQCQLRAIEKQSGLRISLEATAVLVHQVAGISHAGVQCRPRRTKYPVWRIEPWLFQRLNYASDMYM